MKGKPKLKVSWISAGVSSFIAAWLVKDTVDKFIYIHIDDQEDDSLRFISDCAKLLGKPIEIYQSPLYKNVDEVIRDKKIVRHINGYAPCTALLKKLVRRDWEAKNSNYEITYVWGMDLDEKNRAFGEWIVKDGEKVWKKGIVDEMPQFNHEFPLIDKQLKKSDAHAICQRLGVKRPAMYDMGYQNNNCRGCVKGGMWYWNKIRKDFPEVFRTRSETERVVNSRCLKECFLDELDEDAGRESDEIMQECSMFCNFAIGGNNNG